MKPGKPLTFAKVPLGGAHGSRSLLVFGLPGNPVSSLVTFHLAVVPCLRALTGWQVRCARVCMHTRASSPHCAAQGSACGLLFPTNPPQRTRTSNAGAAAAPCARADSDAHQNGSGAARVPPSRGPLGAPRWVAVQSTASAAERCVCGARQARTHPSLSPHPQSLPHSLPIPRAEGAPAGACCGELVAASTGGQISSRLLSLRSANLLLEIPQASGVLPAGTLVSALVLGDLGATMPVPETPAYTMLP